MQFLHRRQTIQNLQNPDAGHASITEIGMHPSESRQIHFPIHQPPSPQPDALSEQVHILPSQNRPSAPPVRHLLQPVHAGTAQSPHPVVRSAVLSSVSTHPPHKKGGGRILSMKTDSGGASPPQGHTQPHTMHRCCRPILPPGRLKPEREIGCAPLRGEPQAECGIARGIIHAQPCMRGDGETARQGRQAVCRLGGGGSTAGILPLQYLRHEEGIHPPVALPASWRSETERPRAEAGSGSKMKLAASPFSSKSSSSWAISLRADRSMAKPDSGS